MLLAVFVAELLLTFPPGFLEHNHRFYNPARFDPYVAAKKLRESGKLVYTLVPDAFDHQPIGRAGEGVTPVPLAGLSHRPLVLCNETGRDLIIDSDQHGFSNPDSVWTRDDDIALIGDSFVHGECAGPQGDIASSLRNDFVVLNAGISGAGPITELAALREYVVPRRTPLVFWFFYEGNDVEDLEKEKTRSISRYLDSSFTQGLALRQAEIDSVARVVIDSTIEHRKPPGRAPSLADFVLLRRVRGLFNLRFHPAPGPLSLDSGTLKRVLATANNSVKSYGGKLVLVYLPDRRRFSGEATTIEGRYDLDAIRRLMLQISGSQGIETVDIADAFGRSPDPTRLWAGRRSHYNARGYELIAGQIRTFATRVHSPH